MRTFVQRAIALLIFLIAPLAGGQAQDYPSRPVQFIVPYAAGGSGDLLARLLGEKLSNMWGKQVVIDNRPGAGGLIGTEAAARAEPNGYTIYLATDGPVTVAATLHKRLNYDWKRDFMPVSMIAVGPQIMLTSLKIPATNLKDFIALAQKEPGKLNYASIGIGTAPHLGAELFMSIAKVNLTHIPYRGSTAQAVTALIAGDVAMYFVGTSSVFPQVKAGTVRGMAVTSPARVASMPDVPTFAELGFPGVDNSLWFAVMVPSGTPAAIVKKLSDDIGKVVADPEYKKALADRGFEAQSSKPDVLAAFLEKDYQKNKVLIEKLGLKVE
jgi:tripartite-type tricarboxylate transporter receptor subunit TctC